MSNRLEILKDRLSKLKTQLTKNGYAEETAHKIEVIEAEIKRISEVNNRKISKS